MIENLLIKTTHAADGITIPTTSNQSDLMTFVTGPVATTLGIVAGALAFIYLIYSGILYLTAAGNPDAAKKGQQGIINAIIGIVVIVAAWTILTIVANTATGVAQ